MRGLKIRVKRSYHWHLELSKSSQSLVTINQAESSLPQRCQKVPKNSRNSFHCRHLTPTYCGAGVNPFTSFSLKNSFAYHQCCEKSEVLTERIVTNERWCWRKLHSPNLRISPNLKQARQSSLSIGVVAISLSVAIPWSLSLNENLVVFPLQFHLSGLGFRPSVKNRSIKGSVISFLRDRERERGREREREWVCVYCGRYGDDGEHSATFAFGANGGSGEATPDCAVQHLRFFYSTQWSARACHRHTIGLFFCWWHGWDTKLIRCSSQRIPGSGIYLVLCFVRSFSIHPSSK
jgi:hypothetical protein